MPSVEELSRTQRIVVLPNTSASLRSMHVAYWNSPSFIAVNITPKKTEYSL